MTEIAIREFQEKSVMESDGQVVRSRSDGLLIVNADDWGGWRSATDAALECFRLKRITSATAMVFMEDSIRAAKIAREEGLPTGLHINFNQQFTGIGFPEGVDAAHRRITSYLRRNKFAQLVYHPGLRGDFRFVFKAQLDEFVRLYGRMPSHFDGHQHMHLCMNALLDRIIPEGHKVRRSYSFWPGEKSALNRIFRRCVDRMLRKRYVLTDYFFSLGQCLQFKRMERVQKLAKNAAVELMTHPENSVEHSYLLSDAHLQFVQNLTLSSYAQFQESI